VTTLAPHASAGENLIFNSNFWQKTEILRFAQNDMNS